MADPHLYAVIMAGGSGTRFWPASRRNQPKQFLPIAGERTMLAATAERLAGLVDHERLIVVCGREHADLVRRSLPDLPAANLLAEPVGRNTAPCVAWAALEIRRRDPRAVQVVLPADHAIEPAEAFRSSLRAAVAEAAGNATLVTLGIRPTRPATGYGYIEAGEGSRGIEGHAVLAVTRFVEKPDLRRAQEFIDTGRFFWNGGIFVWRTDAILDAFRRHLPEVVERLAAARTGAEVEAAYPRLPSQAVDVAILEKAAAEERVRMVPIDYSWSDLGSWNALGDVHPVDEHGTCVAGGTALAAHDAAGCVVWGEPGTLTALVGVRDLIVVRAGNVTLICPRERAEDVRRIVAELGQEHDGFA
jgi:mannose-1-phosphate guanylyltransferase